MTENKNSSLRAIAIIGCTLVIIIAAGAVFLLSSEKDLPLNSTSDTLCHIDWFGNLEDSCVPLFRINGTDTFQYVNFSGPQWKEDTPSPEDSKTLAVTALEPFGGMPPDAAVESIVDSLWSIGGTSGHRSGLGNRRLSYRQSPYGMPIYGNAGDMWIDLNSGRNLSVLSKKWYSLEEDGLIRIIPASEALHRFKENSEKTSPDSQYNLTIRDMKLGYSAPSQNTSAYLEPVWVINATNEILGTPQLLIIPAGTIPDQKELYGKNLFGNIRNFTLLKGKVPKPDIPREMHNYLVGPTGPLGEEQIKESIRSFLDHHQVNLTYQGRAVRLYRCGDEYLGDYSVASTGNCSFEVDSYSGMVIKAFVDNSCSDIRIGNLPAAIKNDPDSARKLIADFARKQYRQYDTQDVSVFPMGWDGVYYLKGKSVLFIVAFDPVSGNLQGYQVFNHHSDLLC
jgi:hypothetical protein